ncbi:MAG: formate dehydrogenase subunit gamma [Phaeovulum sp.]|uniref:formate dehydrogenase subunit gamma n=1 Tax=Phaeovulum sp. TaxID=2934796 RepID=UPI0027318FE5|nr:formate dehydrogenase subunit gamma [Phaeovulum sp.]MDP2063499.1 formate dehydrogenase subunit gamma [Phaeovulum sp.]
MPEPSQTNRVAEICQAHAGREGALLPILHAVQAEFGHVPSETLPLLAKALAVTVAEVQGVVSFYHDFRAAPAGRHVLKICRAEACQAMGAVALAEAAKARLGVDWHGTSAGGVTLEPVFCLGLCAAAPALMLNGVLAARVDVARLGEMLAEAGA